MKRICAMVLTVLFLCGCNGNDDFDRAMQLRTSLLNSNGCSFEATVTAAFAEHTYAFVLDCTSDHEGGIRFIVSKPEAISGITGSISAEGGKLIFDETALMFALQTDGLMSPVSAPWVLVRAMRGGYVRYCAREEEKLRVTVDDSYEDDALTLDIWFNNDDQPIQADIFENNRRIITISIRNYRLL